MNYDVIVVGGGHAGCEASLAASRMNQKTLLITANINMIAAMSCNPSIGGPAKGIVVREIDALGGEMAKIADRTQIQIKMLNNSKGPAVRALRAQSDKLEYPREMVKVLMNTDNLDVKEAYVKSLIVEDMICKGIELEDGTRFFSKSVILTTGTYLRSRVLVGKETTQIGPDNQKTTSGISEQLKALGFDLIRLKTGTPPRVKKQSIDYSKTSIQPGDDEPHFFSFDPLNISNRPNIPCYLTYTNHNTHVIINSNLNESAMYGGVVEGVGPRYCPSIEDKIVRFNDKERHQIFLEPESMELDEIYVQGFSTSMPKDIQELMVKSIPGLENAEIIRYAYAIEYDAVSPTILFPSLETKIVKNLFFAGQINGTSGYEEAAGQGLMAGINASLSIKGLEPLVLKRNEAYIGVMIDDLVTKGVSDPYRLLTSRAEYRLLLRHDNADLRLRNYGKQIGLIDDEKYSRFLKKKQAIIDVREILIMTKLNPSDKINSYLSSINSSPLRDSISSIELLKRPEITYKHIKSLVDLDYTDEVVEQVEIQVKYEGYIEKAIKQVEKMSKVDEKSIPNEIDYKNIMNLSLEAREKLAKIRPINVGQASRISGVTPSDISILLVYLESYKYGG